IPLAGPAIAVGVVQRLHQGLVSGPEQPALGALVTFDGVEYLLVLLVSGNAPLHAWHLGGLLLLLQPGQQLPGQGGIGAGQQQILLHHALRRFGLMEAVVRPNLGPHDLAGAGDLEPLRRTLVGLDFRQQSISYDKLVWGTARQYSSESFGLALKASPTTSCLPASPAWPCVSLSGCWRPSSWPPP